MKWGNPLGFNYVLLQKCLPSAEIIIYFWLLGGGLLITPGKRCSQIYPENRPQITNYFSIGGGVIIHSGQKLLQILPRKSSRNNYLILIGGGFTNHSPRLVTFLRRNDDPSGCFCILTLPARQQKTCISAMKFDGSDIMLRN